jgi:hypothetical protein
MYDIANDFFTGSSSKNQNRLHLGFHYPRSHATRVECVKGFKRFMESYGNFVHFMPNNLYCIDKDSMIDFETYKAIYKHENIAFQDVESLCLPLEMNMDMFDGVIKVPEGFIDFRAAQAHFRELYADKLLQTYDAADYDLLIDCTYSALSTSMYYEMCVSFVYEYLGDCPNFSITVMDGKFWSLYLYDYEKKLYTLTDVEFTPLGSEEARADVEAKVKHYIPNFHKEFRYKSFFLSRKAKPTKRTDDRSLIWQRDGNLLRFSGGKITGIFSMEDVLLEQLLPQMQ